MHWSKEKKGIFCGFPHVITVFFDSMLKTSSLKYTKQFWGGLLGECDAGSSRWDSSSPTASHSVTKDNGRPSAPLNAAQAKAAGHSKGEVSALWITAIKM